ncbi:SusC/RagA family TonB-linked outer membrane protein [Chitinophaga silvatica]|uniref:SusC/RagA family TonB-linked outer membrane protein n=1 Tax=Chitinophaga silvatica TaxID=2282649 RepID=A0A3E1YEV0_9BACT|nr:SusC/RagA family TonB-linked outer membrane protein [Chitinophaga silvatica]RFS25048.1 SusC/RagA family TonB-linked outer membrane protein [Chitinophaga silvatica]
MKINSWIPLIVLCCFCWLPLAAQDVNSVLNKKISIEVNDKPALEILPLIEKQTGVSFAYSHDVINSNKYTIHEKSVPVTTVLEKLFPASKFTVKAVGNQIIIKSTAPAPKKVADTIPAPKIVEMNTVVVTALGISRQQRSLGYAFTDVKGNEMTSARSNNPLQALTGKVAGLDVYTTNSGVGGSVKVTLRGVKVIGGDNQPLYVIDGVPANNSSPGQADKWGGYDLGDGTSIINPDEIATISVLKGGAATALYGSRAANGVILITTKKGAGQGFEVELTSNTVVERLNNNYDFQDSYGTGRDGLLPKDVTAAIGSSQASWGPKLSADSLVWLWNGQRVPYVNANNSIKKFFRNGLTLTNSVALSSGNEKTQFRLTYTNLKNNDIVPKSGLMRHNLSVRGTSQLTKNLNIDAKVSYVNENVDNRPALSDNPNNIGYVLSGISPNIDINWLKQYKDSVTGNYINWNNNSYQVNPYWAINEQPNNSKQDRLNGFVQLRYKISPSLSVQGRVGTDYSQFGFREFMEATTPYNESGAIVLRSRTLRETNSELMFNYNKQIRRFQINANAGTNRMDYSENQLITNGRDISTRGVKSINNFLTKTSNEIINRKRINSVYGSVNLGYNNLLYLDLTGRNDWSSTLAMGNNSYFYPSASASFVFSELMAKSNFLSFGKVRFSIAQTGTDAVDPYQLTLTYGSNTDIPTIGGYAIGGVSVDKVPLHSLKPSISKTYETGANLVFFDNRVNLDFTWYQSNTRNQILSAPISSTSGYTSAVINSGNIRNRGIEVTLGVKPIVSKHFNWDLNLNFARNRNKILELSPLVSGYYTLASARWANASIVAQEGEQYGIIVGRKFLRNDQGQLILDNKLMPQYDPTDAVLGSGQYDWIGGINNRFSYKNFALGVLLDIKQGGNIYSMTNLLAYMNGRQKGTVEGRDEWAISEAARKKANKTPEEWTATGGVQVHGVQQSGVDASGKPIYKEVSGYVNPQTYWQKISDNIPEPFIYDASFVKVRQLTLDYRFPKSIIGTGIVRELTVSFVARNLITISKHIPNVDPESSYNNSNGQGFEYGSLPTRKSYGINIYAKF